MVKEGFVSRLIIFVGDRIQGGALFHLDGLLYADFVVRVAPGYRGWNRSLWRFRRGIHNPRIRTVGNFYTRILTLNFMGGIFNFVCNREPRD